MAVSLNATMSVSNSSVVNGQVINGVVTVNNVGTTATTVQTIQLITGNQLTNGGAGSVALNSVNVNGPGMVNSLAGNSSVSFPFSTVVYCGLQPTTSTANQFAFPLLANVGTSDGSFVQSSTATVQCVPPQDVPYQSPGQFPFTPSPGPLASTTVLTPAVPGQSPNPPVQGQMRLDSNLNSGLGIAVL